MQLKELYGKYTTGEILAAIDEMFPGTEAFHDTFSEALDIMRGLTPIASKKRIRYRIIDDKENDIQYFGAEDSNFNTTWEVCLAKEVVKDDDVELSDLEIAANSLVNLCLTGRCPRQFLPQKQALLNSGGDCQ